jgi:hypothetical protein
MVEDITSISIVLAVEHESIRPGMEATVLVF